MLVAFACYSSTEVKSFCVIKSKNTTTERGKKAQINYPNTVL